LDRNLNGFGEKPRAAGGGGQLFGRRGGLKKGGTNLGPEKVDRREEIQDTLMISEGARGGETGDQVGGTPPVLQRKTNDSRKRGNDCRPWEFWEE